MLPLIIFSSIVGASNAQGISPSGERNFFMYLTAYSDSLCNQTSGTSVSLEVFSQPGWSRCYDYADNFANILTPSSIGFSNDADESDNFVMVTFYTATNCTGNGRSIQDGKWNCLNEGLGTYVSFSATYQPT